MASLQIILYQMSSKSNEITPISNNNKTLDNKTKSPAQ
jgi:hypothetical protein